MHKLSRIYQIKSLQNVLAIGVGMACAGSVSAMPPDGIVGDVTVQNDASNPVPVEVINGPVPVEITNDPLNVLPVEVTGTPINDVVLHFRFDSDDHCGPSVPSQGIAHVELAGRSVAAEPYFVPAGNALVINHLNWEVVAQPGDWSAGQYLNIIVGPNSGQFLLTTGTIITSDLAAAANLAGTENINGGLVFHEGEPVCIFSTLQVGTVGASGPSLNGTKLHGYLVSQ